MFKKFFTLIMDFRQWYDTHRESRVQLIETLYKCKDDICDIINGVKLVIKGVTGLTAKIATIISTVKTLQKAIKVAKAAA